MQDDQDKQALQNDLSKNSVVPHPQDEGANPLQNDLSKNKASKSDFKAWDDFMRG
jgi:hypothetical protein